MPLHCTTASELSPCRKVDELFGDDRGPPPGVLVVPVRQVSSAIDHGSPRWIACREEESV
jgi:hypothetical protein